MGSFGSILQLESNTCLVCCWKIIEMCLGIRWIQAEISRGTTVVVSGCSFKKHLFCSVLRCYQLLRVHFFCSVGCYCRFLTNSCLEGNAVTPWISWYNLYFPRIIFMGKNRHVVAIFASLIFGKASFVFSLTPLIFN